MDPLFDFTGKVVLVTGGSRGLGYQMVKAFTSRGADVGIASLSWIGPRVADLRYNVR